MVKLTVRPKITPRKDVCMQICLQLEGQRVDTFTYSNLSSVSQCNLLSFIYRNETGHYMENNI